MPRSDVVGSANPPWSDVAGGTALDRITPGGRGWEERFPHFRDFHNKKGFRCS